MQIDIHSNKGETGKAAAKGAAAIMKELLSTQESVRFIAATGASQFEFLDHLCRTEGIDWSRTEMFHLDEYVGIPESHPASFVGYLRDRLVNRVHPGKVHFLRGDAEEPEAERAKLSELISKAPIDIAFVGIGENGHLAFNDPPADFETEEPYLILELDDRCRAQQVGEGWFRSINEVPPKAYTMSIRQILKSRHIICTVPDTRKAEAVRNCLADDVEVTPQWPASILKTHEHCKVFLDQDSASELPR
ncbi:MAG: glucosamine-6-phosphate deaminase [Spirochaetota bacterium]